MKVSNKIVAVVFVGIAIVAVALVYLNSVHTGMQLPIILPAPQTDEQASTTPVTVPGMTKYTDSDFGFSFWYPSSWTLQATATKDNYVGGTIQKTLTLASPSVTLDPNGQNGDAITIDEYYSPTLEIGIARELCSPMSGATAYAHRFYFDINTHTWMEETPAYTGESEKDGTQFSVPDTTLAANVSNNTMGGLHMLSEGCSGVVIPLSAKNFVVFSFSSRNIGEDNIDIAKTIIATDPSVATPVSTSEQVQIITTAGVLLGGIGTKVGEWYVTREHVYNARGDVVIDANPPTFRLFSTYSDGTAGTPYATDGVHVFAAWSYDVPVLVGADPVTFVPIRQEYQISYAKSSGAYGQSFAAYDDTFAKDKSHVWYESRLIPGADPHTFVVTGDTLVQNSTGIYVIAHDAYHVYGKDNKDRFTIDSVVANL